MSDKIGRVNMTMFLDNDDLLMNSDMINNVMSQRSEVIDMDFEPFNKNKLLHESFPTEYEMETEIGEKYDGNLSDLENDFETSQMITRSQLKMLTMALKIAYAKFDKSGSDDDFKSIMEVTYAINSTKKDLMGAHKDRVKVKKDSAETKGNGNITTTGTINIQNNTFQGTPNDMLNRYGNAIDIWDEDTRNNKNGDSEK